MSARTCQQIQMTFCFFLTNMSRLDTLNTPTNPFNFDFCWLLVAKQITNPKRIRYVNMNKSTYNHWTKHVSENLAAAMRFIFLVIIRFFFSDTARLCSFIRHIFVLYRIHQNNPVSKSLRCIIPWFLCNRSYGPVPLATVVMPQATVVSQSTLPSSGGEYFGDYYTKTRKGTSQSFWCKVYHARMLFSCKFERDRWWQRGAKTSRSERPCRCYLDDGSFARLPSVRMGEDVT